MPFSSIIGPAISLFGGLLQGNSSSNASNTQAQSQNDAARIAAEEARFRPVGITTRFGQSNFQTGPDGRVSGAGYTLDPALQAYQNRFMGLAGGGLSQAEGAQQQFAPLGQAAQGLFNFGQRYLNQPTDQQLGNIANQYLGSQPNFGLDRIGQRLLNQNQNQTLTDIAQQQFGNNVGAQALSSLGQQYLAQSPQQASQQYMAQQQELLAPSRARQLANVQNSLFNSGRQGLSIGATGLRPSGALGLNAANPEMEAYYNALAQQDAGLASQAMQAGQQQSAFGANLINQSQALGQGQINFGASLLAQQQAQEAQRLGLGSGFTTAQQALEQGRYGFGADLLNRQQNADRQQQTFGAGLFGTAGNLLTQQYGGQTSALAPYDAYLQQMKGLESLGQQPLSLGMDIGASNRNPTGANALFQGGMNAAQTQANANNYNPFATALFNASNSKPLVSGLQRMFGNQPTTSGFGANGYGAGVNPLSGEYMGSTEF